MTIEEKMEHFKSVSLENASNRSNDILTAYKKSLDEQFESHKESALADSKAMEDAKLGAMKLKAKRNLSKAQAELRRSVTTRQNQLKSQVFALVNDKLNEYKKTEDYRLLLIKQINTVLNDFKDTTVTFYIDPSDNELLDSLSKETGADIQISTIPFIGGTKAIIDAKNMLVDNSFKTKLFEEQEHFTISF